MHLAQVEHWWLNDYVTVSASVSGELLPTSVTFHEVTQSINILTTQVLLFRHEILGYTFHRLSGTIGAFMFTNT